MKKKLLLVLLVLVLALSLVATVACDDKDKTTPAENATALLRLMYKDEAKATPFSYDLVSKIVVDGETYDVTWSSDVTDKAKVDFVKAADGKSYTVKIDEYAAAAYDYKIIATVNDGENTSTVEFERQTPKFELMTFAQYASAKKNAIISVDGLVTGIISKSDAYGNSSNGLYLQDLKNEGGYYVYNLSQDPIADGIKVGMKIRVKGFKDTYNGTYEIVNSRYTVLDNTQATVTPVDFTDKFKAAADTKASELVAQQGMLVTIKGVTLTTTDEDKGYYNFELKKADPTKKNESYIRISSSSCPMTKADRETFISKFEPQATADVTGLVTVYSGAFYLTPVSPDAISNIKSADIPDADRVAADKEALKLEGTLAKVGDSIDLPDKGTLKSEITWAFKAATDLLTIAEGKLTVAKIPTEHTDVILVATVKHGSVTETKEITVRVFAPVTNDGTAAKPYTPGEAAIECAKLEADAFSTTEIYVKGYVIADGYEEYSTQYKNISFWLSDTADGSRMIQFFRGVLAAEDQIPYIGDLVIVKGYIQNYKGDTIEYTTKKKDVAPTTTADVKPAVSSIVTRGDGSIKAATTNDAKVTVTITSPTPVDNKVTGKNGTEVKFTVAVSGTTHKIDTVKVGKTPLLAETGVYTAIINGNQEIVVTLKEVGDPSQAEKNVTWTFNKGETSTSDSSSDLNESGFNTILQPEGLKFVSATKAYKGKNGTLKFSTSSVNGVLTLSVNKNVAAKKLVINANAWTNSSDVADAAKIKVTVKDSTGTVIKELAATDVTATAADFTVTFDSEIVLEDCTITIEATKRLYVTSIAAKSE